MTILLLRVRQPRAAEVCEGDDILRCGTQFNGESRPTGQYSMATCVNMRPPGRNLDGTFTVRTPAVPAPKGAGTAGPIALEKVVRLR